MITAKKHLGQNFLRNTHILENIVGFEELSEYDVVEIGPGPGDLTASILAKHPKSLHVVEIDDDMIPLLEERFGDTIRIHHGDILKTQIVTGREQKGILISGKYKAYGNIPYYITSPILMHFLYEIQHTPISLTITMQKEVADRILAKNGKHSVLSLACQLMSTVSKVCDIHPNNFSPAPKVWSTCLCLTLKQDYDARFAKKMLTLIKQGFAQKRKKLSSNLVHAGYESKHLENVFRKIHISETVRAEDLSIDQWKLLSDSLL